MFFATRVTEEVVRNYLRTIPKDKRGMLVSQLSGIAVQDGHVIVTFDIDPAGRHEAEMVAQEIENDLRCMKGVKSVRVILTAQIEPESKPAKPQQTLALLPGVKHIIAVASGKGGVGKSTVAANLAVALAQQGMKTGLLDADVYGPSVPMLMGVRQDKPQQDENFLIPLEAHGVKLMSMGSLVGEEAAMIWRGPMVQSALLQMMRDVAWGELDILLIDMPPGTGDTQLTIAQRVNLRGAIIVSTPQDIALLDAAKAVQMFQKTSVPVFGLIENMSYFICQQCGTESHVFGHHGAKHRAAAMGIDFLGEIPLKAEICLTSDQGRPIAADMQSSTAEIFAGMAAALQTRLLRANRSAPKIIFED